MERLTISGGEITFYEPIYAKCSNKNASKIQKQIDKNIPFYDMIGYKSESITIRKIEDIYNKLAKLEDVLEKYDIESAEDLEILLSANSKIKTNTFNSIQRLKHQLAVKDKALELACKDKDLCDGDSYSICPYCAHYTTDKCPNYSHRSSKYFIAQAEKELKDDKTRID